MVVVAGMYGSAMRRKAKLQAVALARERRMREELEAYAGLEVMLAQEAHSDFEQLRPAKALATSVCRTVAQKSVFRRVLMLLRDAEGNLCSVGSTGVDDLTLNAVERWAKQVVSEENEEREGSLKASTLAGDREAKSIPISLGEWQQFDREISAWELSGKKERRRWRRAIVLPVRTIAGKDQARRLVGAIVVCTDGLAVPVLDEAGGRLAVEQMLSPLESLAAMLGPAMQNAAQEEQMLRAEKQYPDPEADGLGVPSMVGFSFERYDGICSDEISGAGGGERVI